MPGSNFPDSEVSPGLLQLGQFDTVEAFELAPDCQFFTDEAGVIERSNIVASELLGYSREFLVGKPLGVFFVDGGRSRFYESLVRLRSGVTAEVFWARVGRTVDRRREVVVVGLVKANSRGRHTSLGWVFRDLSRSQEDNAQRRDLLMQLGNAQEDERRRIARELHDSLGQLLAALKISVHMARTHLHDPQVVSERLTQVDGLADELGRAVHSLALRLRPVSLDDLGLHAALSQLTEEWSRMLSIPIEYEFAANPGTRWPPAVETTAYRVVQEALTNVARHARATRASVTINEHQHRLRITVEDDGIGIPQTEDTALGKRLGLRGMRERVELLKGKLEIESRAHAGTTVLASIPFHGGRRGGPGTESAGPPD